MKKLLMIIAVLGLSACTPENRSLSDDGPYLGGKTPPETSPRPQPRPQRASDRNPDCPHKHISADCDPDREPPEVECTMLWKPGTMLAIREKECAALA